MDNSMKIYWELYFNNFPVDKILRQTNNPIREYEDELIEGAIMDIGCGQSSFLLDFAHSDREIIAIDNEQLQLDYLMERVKSYKSANIENWSFNLLNFPNDKLPNKEYSLIIFSNILHFFSLIECIEIGKIVNAICQKGTLIYAGVHSHKFYANNPKDPNNNDYFKHYFTIEDLEKVFPKENFERIYYAEIEKTDPEVEAELTEKWLDKSLEADGITDPRHIEFIKKDYMKNKNQSDIVTIFRKK